jgi:uncharacterized protein YdcH (DUF465 family)
MSTVQDLRSSLIAEDPEFQRLAQEHSRCDTQLEQLITQNYLSSEDLIEEVTLKKRKLQLKDQMEQLLAKHRRSMGLR